MDQMLNRKFKTRHIITYAGILVFIVYACDSTANFDSTNATLRDRDFYVKLLVNEAPVAIPGCGSDTWLYSAIRNMYNDNIDNCNIKAPSNNDGPTDTGTGIYTGLMVPLFVLCYVVLVV